jgi:hypothetical protein
VLSPSICQQISYLSFIVHRFNSHRHTRNQRFTSSFHCSVTYPHFATLKEPDTPFQFTMVCNSVSCRAGSDKTSCFATTRQATTGPLNPEIKVVPVSYLSFARRNPPVKSHVDDRSEMPNLHSQWTRELGYSRTGMWLLWHQLLSAGTNRSVPHDCIYN